MGALCFLVCDQVQVFGHRKALLIFIDDLLEDEQGLSMGGLLTVINGSFYPLSYINIGMHLISKPLFLTHSRDIFVHACVFGRYLEMQVFWAILVFIRSSSKSSATRSDIKARFTIQRHEGLSFQDDMKTLREQGELMKSPGTLQLPDLSRRISRSKLRPKAHKR